MTKPLKDNRWTILFALLCVLAFQAALPVAQHFWQANRPIVAMHGVIVQKTPDHIDIRISGEKLRTCAFVSLSAMTRVDGLMIDAELTRIDGRPDTWTTKPPGKYDLGVWRIRPIEGATKAFVFVQHDCDSTVVLTKIAEVDL